MKRGLRSGWVAATVLALIGIGDVAAAPTQTRTLANGMKVAVLHDPRLPLVQIQALVPAGSRHEGSGESGAARLTALMLARGTTSRPAAEFVREVEGLGGTMRSDASRDYASISGTFRAADFDRGIELVADALTNPIFPDGEFEDARRQLLRSVVQSRRTLGSIAEEHVWARTLRGHPYAIPEGGTLEGVAGLTRSRVIAFHRAHYRPNGVFLAVAGNVDPARAIAAIEEAFSGWGGQARPSAATAPAPADPGIRLVDVPGAAEAEIRLAFRVPSSASEERHALIVLNDLLGAGPASRLGGGSRVLQRYSNLDLERDAGLLVVGTAAPNDSVPAAIARLRAELARFAAQPPTAAEVEQSRRTLARSQPLRLESLGARTAQWLSAAYLGAESDLDRDAERYEAVTAEAVRAAITRHLKPDDAQIVVVGAASVLKTPLEALGPVEVVSIQSSAAPVDLGPAMQTAEPSADALARGRKLIQQALAAHGGLARLKGVRDSRAEAEITLYNAGESVKGKQTELRREPYHLRIESSFLQISTVQSLHGDSAWSRVTAAAGDSVLDEDAEGVAGLRHTYASDMPRLLLAAADPKTRAAFRGREDLASGPADVVEIVTGAGQRWVLFLDAQHRLVAVEENQGSPLLGPALRRLLADHRSIDGLMWPHSEERLINGERTLTLQYRSVKINSGIPASAFRRPQGQADPGHRRR